MAKPNYSFAKRQRELEKKNKKEEKRKNKAEGKNDPEDGTLPDNADDAPAEIAAGTDA
jgi:hypothetical protein